MSDPVHGAEDLSQHYRPHGDARGRVNPAMTGDAIPGI